MAQVRPAGRSLARRLILAALNHEDRGHSAVPTPRHPTMADLEAGTNFDPESAETTRLRALTGIDSAPALSLSHHSPRTAPNVGIYTRVVQAETKAAKHYRFHSALINTCLGIQIVVAATLTALGAARGPHNAITAFGAINTIVAGILTYLKGSGLPDRLKHYQNEWRNIREYIEQRERELCLQNCELDVEEEIQIIEQMYEGVKREIEATKSGGDNNRTSGRDPSNRRTILPTSGQRREHTPRMPSPARTIERPMEKV
ncbi:hypothetical protein ASPSYDRAFT_55738 [Aspergillus sydowii CBS 593.65]|uniref:SMODS and SLOG-associating 2TM effector domain-containing protein n=1 Tax=Aspergillus sydowii CBS 593.65 TaxID=1036612 RepID=A0A1L9TUD8_9EURO|nr:uncharacterized protein ASPSYDRAFT_55738 [Aspergillus sydowii CBS 593.65]OJJ63049.1 hypothetical protein ASPSYDRAFT_55738 [Aspergillus sydowii CBS 593.65]